MANKQNIKPFETIKQDLDTDQIYIVVSVGTSVAISECGVLDVPLHLAAIVYDTSDIACHTLPFIMEHPVGGRYVTGLMLTPDISMCDYMLDGLLIHLRTTHSRNN